MAKVRIIINRSKKDRMGLCPLKVRVTHAGQRKEVYLVKGYCYKCNFELSFLT